MSEPGNRLPLYDDLIRRFASAIRGAQLYAPNHPLIARNLEALLDTLGRLHASHPSLTIGVVGDEIIVADTPLPKAAAGLGELIRRLQAGGIERITIDQGVTVKELMAFMTAVGSLGPRAAGREPVDLPSLPHIRVGRISADPEQAEGIASDIAAIRRLYSDATQAAQDVWDSAQAEGKPELRLARNIVDGLAETATQNRTALIALTAMKSYDNYTFTHMVNVSILTMGQARALGIEGHLLREFGLSALMHDIGKVRTPVEILNKSGKLTDDEFTVMKRHVVDGAEILRQTPEMPILAPIVAFEHHLRLDGTGYPEPASRPQLNVGTMLCSIADVYDAMRSQRTYQQAFPTDRILAVLKRNDGSQFDPHLVRRFVQLIGIYPPGTLVRLSTGEIAVVLQVHAPDAYHPRVRLLADANGVEITSSQEWNLWETEGDEAERAHVVAPLDPKEYGIDPLIFL